MSKKPSHNSVIIEVLIAPGGAYYLRDPPLARSLFPQSDSGECWESDFGGLKTNREFTRIDAKIGKTVSADAKRVVYYQFDNTSNHPHNYTDKPGKNETWFFESF